MTRPLRRPLPLGHPARGTAGAAGPGTVATVPALPYAKVERQLWAGVPVWTYTVLVPADVAGGEGWRIAGTGARPVWREAFTAASVSVTVVRAARLQLAQLQQSKAG